MTVEYTWSIQDMKRNTSDDGVFEVTFRVSALRGTCQASELAVVELTPDPLSDTYIAYADLTENDVITWVRSVVGQSAMEEEVLNKLNILHPEVDATPVVQNGIPWSSSE